MFLSAFFFYRKAWIKQQRIVHSYGTDEEECIAICPELQECPDSSDMQPPLIPSTLPTIPEDVDICVGGRGCNKCGSLSHKRSNHKDCPYNKNISLNASV